jgi:hypothetical protein
VKHAGRREAARAWAASAKLEDERQKEKDRIIAAYVDINDDLLAQKAP